MSEPVICLPVQSTTLSSRRSGVCELRRIGEEGRTQVSQCSGCKRCWSVSAHICRRKYRLRTSDIASSCCCRLGMQSKACMRQVSSRVVIKPWLARNELSPQCSVVSNPPVVECICLLRAETTIGRCPANRKLTACAARCMHNDSTPPVKRFTSKYGMNARSEPVQR